MVSRVWQPGNNWDEQAVHPKFTPSVTWIASLEPCAPTKRTGIQYLVSAIPQVCLAAWFEPVLHPIWEPRSTLCPEQVFGATIAGCSQLQLSPGLWDILESLPALLCVSWGSMSDLGLITGCKMCSCPSWPLNKALLCLSCPAMARRSRSALRCSFPLEMDAVILH